jgi:hypothetical protein
MHAAGGSAVPGAMAGRQPVPLAGSPGRMVMMPAGPMTTAPMTMGPMGMEPMHMDLSGVPEALIPYLTTLDEIAHAPHPLPPHDHRS